MLELDTIAPEYFESLQKTFPNESLFKLWLVITHSDVNFANLNRQKVADSSGFKTQSEQDLKRLQRETVKRYQIINSALKAAYTVDRTAGTTDFRARLDRCYSTQILGLCVFWTLTAFLVSNYLRLSSIPMDFIDGTFATLSEQVKTNFPPGLFTNLLAEGVLPGLAGILIFIPQIALLFLFISHFRRNRLHESGGVFNGSQPAPFWP